MLPYTTQSYCVYCIHTLVQILGYKREQLKVSLQCV